jgi:hypothetical protein
MKQYTILTVMLVSFLAIPFGLGGCNRVDLDTATKFQEAEKVFGNAKTDDEYLKAAGIYQSIADGGVDSGAVYYNLGNAMMKAGHRAEAIAAYRKAVPYLADDPYLAANLRYARGEGTVAEARPMIEHLLFWQNRISYPMKVYLSFSLAIVAFVLGLAAIFTQPKFWRWAAVTAVVATVVMVLSTAYDWQRFDATQHGVITSGESIARKGGAEGYEPAFTEPLANGTEFTVIKPRGDWLQISLPDDKEGWIPKKNATVF